MCRAIYISLLVLSLTLSGCVGASISVPTSPTATESPPPSATSAADDPALKIDKVLSSLTEREAFTGAVMVVRNGEVLFSRGYGLADREKHLPNTPQTKYRLASITKTFTATAILMLQAQDKLNVQHPICRYIVDCPATWQDITIHHLLTHTSGIPNFTDFRDYHVLKATPSPPEQTMGRFKDRPLDFPPGEQWRYSNSGYILLGIIIEQASGQPYEAFLQQHIFGPLQMKNTGYDHNDGSLAIGYTGTRGLWREAEITDMTIPYAAGGLYSTVEDLYRWDQALYTEQLVPQEILDLMFTPHAEIPYNGLHYGYGWFVGELNNHRAVAHSGGIDGFATELRRFVDEKVTIIILSNRDTTGIGSTADLIADAVFAEQ